MSDIRARFEAAREAARRLREAQRELDAATDDTAGERAVDAVNTAQVELNRLNVELHRVDGRTVTVDGRIVEGFPDQFEVEGRLATQDAPGVEDQRLVREQGTETADLSPTEVAAKAAELRALQQQRAVEELVEQQTGRPAASLTADEVRKAVRDASLEQSGAAERLREATRPGLPDPLELDDDDIRDDLDALANRELVGEVVGKDPSSVTPADFAELERIKVDAALERAGIDPTAATRLERMQAASTVRNDAFDRQAAERLRAEAPPAAGTGSGGGSAGGSSGDGTVQPPTPDGQTAPPPPSGGTAGGTGGGDLGGAIGGGGGDLGGAAGGGAGGDLGGAGAAGSVTGAGGDGSSPSPGPTEGAGDTLAPSPGIAPAPGGTGPSGGTGAGAEPTGTQVDTVFEASFGEMTFEPNPSGLDSGASFETFHRSASAAQWTEVAAPPGPDQPCDHGNIVAPRVDASAARRRATWCRTGWRRSRSSLGRPVSRSGVRGQVSADQGRSMRVSTRSGDPSPRPSSTSHSERCVAPRSRSDVGIPTSTVLTTAPDVGSTSEMLPSASPNQMPSSVAAMPTTPTLRSSHGEGTAAGTAHTRSPVTGSSWISSPSTRANTAPWTAATAAGVVLSGSVRMVSVRPVAGSTRSTDGPDSVRRSVSQRSSSSAAMLGS
jgi:hypothetical protein